MATYNNLLFSWNNVEQLPEFQRLKRVLDNLPCEVLLEALQQQRGRDDFPLQAMWLATIARIVFQHGSIEHLVHELHRNLGLLQFCGFHSLPRQSAPFHELHHIPKPVRANPTQSAIFASIRFPTNGTLHASSSG